MQVFTETDSEDGGDWIYGTYFCPFQDDVDLDDFAGSVACLGGYCEPMDLIAHVQAVHDVDLDDSLDVDLDGHASSDVDLDDHDLWGLR